MIRKIILFSSAIFLFSCGGSSGGGNDEPVNVNEAPEAVNLVYPSQNLLCIDNTIKFDWSDALDPNKDPISYKIVIAKDRNLSTIVETRNITKSEVSITLEKGIPYYWSVTAFDNKGGSSRPSTTNAFYTKGEGSSNIAPFTAELVSPEDNSSFSGIFVVLKWKGADSNSGDSLKYDVFFGESDDPELKDSNITDSSYGVTVERGKTYYWKINTIDDSNAKSIGQVWSFTVN